MIDFVINTLFIIYLIMVIPLITKNFRIVDGDKIHMKTDSEIEFYCLWCIGGLLTLGVLAIPLYIHLQRRIKKENKLREELRAELERERGFK